MVYHIEEIRKVIPGDYHFFKDHMKPEGVPLKDLSDANLKEYAGRLIDVKKGELMVGKVISRADALQMNPKEFYLKLSRKPHLNKTMSFPLFHLGGDECVATLRSPFLLAYDMSKMIQ